MLQNEETVYSIRNPFETKYKDIDSLITKVHSLEHKLYPLIIKMIVEGEINLDELNGKNFKCYEDEFDL